MSIRRFPGLQSLGGAVFWTDLVNEGGWRVQYNKVPGISLMMKPFRLLDPNNMLWASADSADELADALPELVEEFSKKDPLIDKDDLKKIVGALGAAVLALVVKGAPRR